LILAGGVFGYAYLSAGTSDEKKNDNEILQDVKTILWDVKTVTDKDGNIYETVLIGPLIWMKENLKTTKYNDGTPIPLITNGTAWSHLTSGAYCWYDNDSTNKNTYGALYNWYAGNTNKLCPTGWHAPTENEWDYLERSFQDWHHRGDELKEKGKSHWHSPNTGATNNSGFTALPGGHRSRSLFEYDTIDFLERYDYEETYKFRDTTWRFYGIGYSGYWWGFNGRRFGEVAYTVCLSYNDSDFPPRTFELMDKKEGMSVRCLKYNESYTQDGYPYKEATYGATVQDQDSNTYKTITIGTQTWMAENLKTTKYKNGKAIQLVNADTIWVNLTNPGYRWYNNDPATYRDTYGALYNWYAVNTGRLCPTGWHVPGDAEWTVLTDYLEGDENSGYKLKETWFQHWQHPNSWATNETGFTALPGGATYSEFYGLGTVGLWWSSTGYEDPEDPDASNQYAWSRSISNSSNSLIREYWTKSLGISVRCVKDSK
jgi:uncharacterized protein (TIGR02145 family)